MLYRVLPARKLCAAYCVDLMRHIVSTSLKCSSLSQVSMAEAMSAAARRQGASIPQASQVGMPVHFVC